MKTRILSLLLAVSLLFGLLAVPAAAASRSEACRTLSDYVKAGSDGDTDKYDYMDCDISSDFFEAHDVSFSPSDSRVALPVPVSAASAKDVYNYLKDLAMHGEYFSADKEWFVGPPEGPIVKPEEPIPVDPPINPPVVDK